MLFDSNRTTYTPCPDYLMYCPDIYTDRCIFSFYQIFLTAAYIKPFVYDRIPAVICFSVSYPVTLTNKP